MKITLRVLRGLALWSVVAGGGFFVLFSLAVLFRIHLVHETGSVIRGELYPMFGLVVFTGCIVIGWKGWVSWRTILIGALFVVPCLTYLAWDGYEVPSIEPVAGPAIDPNEGTHSYALLEQFPKIPEQSAAAELVGAIKEQSIDAQKTEDWRAFVEVHREQILKAWSESEELRGWIAALDRFAVIGDLTPLDINSRVLFVGTLVDAGKIVSAYASLCALEGRGDEGVKVLLPWLRVGRNLEPASRTLLRSLGAVADVSMIVKTLRFIASQTEVSQASKALAVRDLKAKIERRQLLRSFLSNEQAAMVAAICKMRFGEILSLGELKSIDRDYGRAIEVVGFLLFNPRLTACRYVKHMAKATALIETRQLAQLQDMERQFETEARNPEIKNVGGQLVIALFVPTVSAIAKKIWEEEDRCLAFADEWENKN